MAEPAPFVRWVGGSQKSLPNLLARLPADAAQLRYVDPFVGGGALFWALRPRRALLSDACAPLMAAWRALAVDPDGLLRELAGLAAPRAAGQHPAWYALVAGLLDADGTDAERGARLIAVNRSCFNGLWRVNSAGRFNAALDPASKGRDLVRADLLRACAAVLGGMDLQVHARSWEATIAAAGAGDLVYADPPYDDESDDGPPMLIGGPVAVQGHRYTAQGWTRADLVRLADALAEAAERGAHVLTTNNPTRFAREVFAARGFSVEVAPVARSVSRDAATRGDVLELYARRAP